MRFYAVLPFLAVEMMSRLALQLKMNIIINYRVSNLGSIHAVIRRNLALMSSLLGQGKYPTLARPCDRFCRIQEHKARPSWASGGVYEKYKSPVNEEFSVLVRPGTALQVEWSAGDVESTLVQSSTKSHPTLPERRFCGSVAGGMRGRCQAKLAISLVKRESRGCLSGHNSC